MQTILIDNNDFHHMPDHGVSDLFNMPERFTIRKALKRLRQVDFGNIGGMHSVKTSGGSYLSVNLETSGGGYLMNSQRAVLSEVTSEGERTIRFYSLKN